MHLQLESVISSVCSIIESGTLNNCVNLMIAAAMALLVGRLRLAATVAAMWIGGTIFGLFACPFIINCMQSTNPFAERNVLADFLVVVPLTLIAVGVIVGIIFLPSVVAFRYKHPKRALLTTLNFIVYFVPFCWLALFFYAVLPAFSPQPSQMKPSRSSRLPLHLVE